MTWKKVKIYEELLAEKQNVLFGSGYLSRLVEAIYNVMREMLVTNGKLLSDSEIESLGFVVKKVRRWSPNPNGRPVPSGIVKRK